MSDRDGTEVAWICERAHALAAEAGRDVTFRPGERGWPILVTWHRNGREQDLGPFDRDPLLDGTAENHAASVASLAVILCDEIEQAL